MGEENRKAIRIALVLAGIPLVMIGALISHIGFRDFIPSYFMGGFGLSIVGAMMIYLGALRLATRVIAQEVGPAVRITGRNVGGGVTRGINDAGGIRLTMDGGGSGSKETVKIRCRNCGYLESEDAVYCSKCGEGL